MTQPLDRPGRYKAKPVVVALEEKDTGTVQAKIAFAVHEYLNGDTWEDWREYDVGISGYFNIIKKDGNPNEHTIKSLRESLGWDGVDLAALQDTDWTDKTVQITCSQEVYEGVTRLKVQWLNPENWEGAQAQPLDSAKVKSLAAKFGAKLRALAPKTSTAKPSAPPPSAPAPQSGPKKKDIPF